MFSIGMYKNNNVCLMNMRPNVLVYIYINIKQITDRLFKSITFNKFKEARKVP